MDTIVSRRSLRHAGTRLLAGLVLAGMLCLAGTGCHAAQEAGDPTAQQGEGETQVDATTQGGTQPQAPVVKDPEAPEGSTDEASTADAHEDDAGEPSDDAPASDSQQQSPEQAARAEALRADLQAAADASGMTCYVSVIDLTDGLAVSCQGQQQIASASMIKMLIAHTFLEQVKAGAFALDDLYTLRASDLVGGTGTLCGLGAGAQVSYRDVLTRMIDVSDNTGANILIDAVGMDAINDDATRLGLSATRLNRKMMDYDAIAAGLENYTCADDLATLFRMAYQGTFVDASSSQLVMSALRQQQDWGGVRSGLPDTVPFAHKTGSLDTVRHDGGIVEGAHPFVLVVLCGGEGFWEQGAESAMARVAQVAYTDLCA